MIKINKDDDICKLSLQEITAETENPCCPSSGTTDQSGGGESIIDEDPVDDESKEPAASDGDVLAKSETANSATTGVVDGLTSMPDGWQFSRRSKVQRLIGDGL